jgi:hypothetical protein
MIKKIARRLFIHPLRRFVRRQGMDLLRDRDQDITALRQRRALETTADFVEQHLAAVRMVHSRDEMLDLAVDAIPSKSTGLCCEFGVFAGDTITRMARRRPELTFHGFDSFKGLPEDWKPGCGREAFDRGGVLPAVPANVELITGWFHESLPPFLTKHPEPAAFLHIDCDLYSSTKCVFDLLRGRLTAGTILLFDEYFNYPGWQEGEHKAWSELVTAENVAFEYLAYNDRNEQLAVRILRAGQGAA